MKREGNFDLLRIISTLAVISIHISTIYVSAITQSNAFIEQYTDNMFFSVFFFAFSRFAVPCFVMLSGAFILDNSRNADFKYFYGKSFKSIGIPTLVFSLFYFCYETANHIFNTLSAGKEFSASTVWTPLKNWLSGSPYYHMWYLYMLIGIYLLAPAVLRLKNDIGDKRFEKITWIFIAAAFICMNNSSHKLSWDIGQSFCYLSYFMLGYVLRKKALFKANNFKGILLITAGIILEFAVTYLRYKQALAELEGIKPSHELLNPFSPLIVIASILIFAGFSYIKLSKDFSKLSSITFYVYLTHGVIRNVYIKFALTLIPSHDSRIVIPLGIIAVFIASAICGIIYKKLWSFIDRKLHIEDKLCKALKLDT